MTASPELSARGGLRWVLLATGVAGVLGYLVQAIAPPMLDDDAAYVSFSIIWSTVYLCGSAMSGVQQEISRATHPSARDAASANDLRRFIWITAMVAAFGGLVAGVLLTVGPVPASAAGLGVAIAVALAGYLITTVLTGTLYGLGLWPQIALLVTLDAVLRAVFLVISFAFSGSSVVLAFAIAVPFGLSALIIWILVWRRLARGIALDVRLPHLLLNVARTVAAAACMGAMISGLPLLMGATSSDVSEAVVGATIFAITLTRAPIVVPVIALQSYLIAAVFRGRSSPSPRRVLRMLGVAMLVTATLSLAGYFVGPPVVSFVSAGSFSISPLMMSTIIASGGLVGVMCVTGAALISTKHHSANLLGWAVAAALTIALLMLPAAFQVRLAAALLLPPLCGLIVHLIALVRRTADDTAG